MNEPAPSFDTRELLREASWIRALARTLADAPERADELEQETWLAALRSRPEVRGGLRPWLAAVMRNAARALARGESHRTSRERASALPEALPSARELAERAEVQRVLVECVLALGEPFRSAVLLRYYEGLDSAEIARRQAIAPATVRSRLARGVQQLRERLDRRHAGDRARWLGALTPLVSSPARMGLVGSIVMKKVALAVAVLALLAVLWWKVATPRPSATLDGDRATASGVPSANEDRSAPTTNEAPTETSNANGGDAPDSTRSAATSSPSLPAPSELRPMRLRLVDDVTREAVPYFRVRLHRGDDPVEELVSDEHGFASSEHGLERGTFELELDDAGSDEDSIMVRRKEANAIPGRVTFEHDPQRSEPIEVAIPVGPTYLLRIAPPPGYALADLKGSLRAWEHEHAFDRVFANLRDGSPPWVRFHAIGRLLSGGPPWKLEVTTSDGLWLGKAKTDACGAGVQRGIVAIVLDSCACLTGRVTDADGKPADTFVRIERDGASFKDPDNCPLVAMTDKDGRYRLGGVPPGEYGVLGWADGHDDAHDRVRLEAGTTRELDLVLPAPQKEGLARIEGRVTSRTGKFGDLSSATLTNLTDPIDWVSVNVAWRDVEGTKSGSFVFEDVRPGRYRVTLRAGGLVRSTGGPRDVEPQQIEVSASDAATPAFVVLDDIATAEICFRAVDERDGSDVNEFSVRVGGVGRDVVIPLAQARAGLACAHDLPVGMRVSYCAMSPGRQPVWGDCSVDGSASPSAPIVLHLRPGWGAQVITVDESNAPLVGARVYFDEAFAGESDATGKLNAALDHVPATARVEYRDWKLAEDGGISLETGRFRTWEPWLRVVMAPPK